MKQSKKPFAVGDLVRLRGFARMHVDSSAIAVDGIVVTISALGPNQVDVHLPDGHGATVTRSQIKSRLIKRKKRVAREIYFEMMDNYDGYSNSQTVFQTLEPGERVIFREVLEPKSNKALANAWNKAHPENHRKGQKTLRLRVRALRARIMELELKVANLGGKP